MLNVQEVDSAIRRARLDLIDFAGRMIDADTIGMADDVLARIEDLQALAEAVPRQRRDEVEYLIERHRALLLMLAN